MTDNEKLIEEARRWPAGVGPIPSAAPGNIIARLTDALEAAEKAHTPTDDEREALRIAHLDARQTAYREHRALWFLDYDNAPEVATNAFFCGWDAAVDAVNGREDWGTHLALVITERLPEPQGEPSDARVEAAARRLFGATVDSMDRARELAHVALTAPALIECPHWAPGKITFRNACTACAAVTEQGENRDA